MSLSDTTELAYRPIYRNVPGADDALAFYRSRGFAISAFVPNNHGHFPLLVEQDCIFIREDKMLKPNLPISASPHNLTAGIN